MVAFYCGFHNFDCIILEIRQIDTIEYIVSHRLLGDYRGHAGPDHDFGIRHRVQITRQNDVGARALLLGPKYCSFNMIDQVRCLTYWIWWVVEGTDERLHVTNLNNRDPEHFADRVKESSAILQQPVSDERRRRHRQNVGGDGQRLCELPVLQLATCKSVGEVCT